MKEMIPKNSIKEAVKTCFDDEVKSIKDYSAGHINKIYEITFKNKKQIILRLYNEAWKAKKEEFVYRQIRSHVDVPIPEIHYVDDSQTILPSAYCIISKLEGMHLDQAYQKYKNKKIIEEAGEILAKLHTIKFDKYGWIIGHAIHPSFSTWKEFVLYDIDFKLGKLSLIKKIIDLKSKINGFVEKNKHLLDIAQKPCLLHKDYHCPHILADKNHVTGIIDLEWALAGHNENDFMKMELWTFNKLKSFKEPFFKGYQKLGTLSHDYEERKKIYELWHWISMVNISFEMKNKTWLTHNIKALQDFLK